MNPNAQPLDDDSAARLLHGLVHPDDAPPGYGAVAEVLNSAARLSLRPVDEDVAAATVTAMVEAIRATGPAPQASRRKTMLGKILAGKALAAVAVLGLTASGAAAATGSLPDPVQNAVSGAVSHVGVDIPHPNHGQSADHRQDGAHHDAADDQGEPGDDAGKPAATNGQDTSTAAHTAKAQAKDAGEKVGPAVCAAVGSHCANHTETSGADDDEATPPSNPGTSGQSGDHGEAGDDHGDKPEVTPPTTATTGSIATGEDHSGRDLPSSSDSSGKGKGKSGDDQ